MHASAQVLHGETFGFEARALTDLGNLVEVVRLTSGGRSAIRLTFEFEARSDESSHGPPATPGASGSGSAEQVVPPSRRFARSLRRSPGVKPSTPWY